MQFWCTYMYMYTVVIIIDPKLTTDSGQVTCVHIHVHACTCSFQFASHCSVICEYTCRYGITVHINMYLYVSRIPLSTCFSLTLRATWVHRWTPLPRSPVERIPQATRDQNTT